MDAALELLTPRGAAGIAVVAARGAALRARLASALRQGAGRFLPDAGPRRPRRAELWLGGECIDEVLVVERPELDLLEVHLHGAESVLAALEHEFGPLVVPPASPAAALLRQATSSTQLALALEQLGYDFPHFLSQVSRLEPAARSQELARLRERSRVAQAQAVAAKLVLCGAQNAGKSTLLNRLLAAERALAGATPGLTRDPVAEATVLGGYPYEIVDTAGEGVATSPLAAAAIARARAEREGALRLVVVDGTRGPQPEDAALAQGLHLFVRTKADMPLAPWPETLQPMVTVCGLDPQSSPAIRELVGEALRRLRALPLAGPVGGPAALDAAQLRAVQDLAAGG